MLDLIRREKKKEKKRQINDILTQTGWCKFTPRLIDFKQCYKRSQAQGRQQPQAPGLSLCSLVAPWPCSLSLFLFWTDPHLFYFFSSSSFLPLTFLPPLSFSLSLLLLLFFFLLLPTAIYTLILSPSRSPFLPPLFSLFLLFLLFFGYLSHIFYRKSRERLAKRGLSGLQPRPPPFRTMMSRNIVLHQLL